MATEFTSGYWSSVETTDDAKRRADELLDILAKRTLIYRTTGGYEWDIEEDADLTEFLQSMVRPASLPHRVLVSSAESRLVLPLRRLSVPARVTIQP